MNKLVKAIFGRSVFAAIAAAVFLTATAANAATFTGTLYYTVDGTGGLSTNVWSQTYSYDDSTHALTLGSKTAIATCPGADGLLASPTAGHLFVGGENTKAVYDVKISDGTFTTLVSPHKSFHLSLSPDKKTLYSSDYYTNEGSGLYQNGIDTFLLPANGVAHAISGADDHGITQIAFAPTTGKVFYTASIPNCCANVGTINLTTFATTKLFHSDVVHSIIYDPFTGLMTMFGIGYTSTMDQNGASFKNSVNLDANFDQGSVDGLGHGFIAGGDHLDFVDYSVNHDMTAPDQFQINTGYTDIDDVVMVPTPPSSGICPLSQGYWKNHHAWPSSCLPMTLGTTNAYTESQLLFILKFPVRGSASRALAYQLIAAKLNICAGADPSPVAATIADADSLIGSGMIGGSYSKTVQAQMTADAKILESYNNGCLTSGCATCTK